MKLQTALVLVVVSMMLTGCFFTKIVTVPMRLGGAVISIVPAVGNTAHDAIDEAASIVDEVPI